jgi:predicted amidohydrolase
MFSHNKDRQVYKKIELSDIDKNHFKEGEKLPIYEMGGIKFGVQICRELLFPLAWSKLKEQGAQIIFHINNAIKPYDNVWEHIVIARAVENSVFVCSVNNASEPQELASYLVDPSGKALLKAEKQQNQTLTANIQPDLTQSPY